MLSSRGPWRADDAWERDRRGTNCAPDRGRRGRPRHVRLACATGGRTRAGRALGVRRGGSDRDDGRGRDDRPAAQGARAVGAGAAPRASGSPGPLVSRAMRRTWIALLLVLALSGVAAGCGGGDDETEADTTSAWASDFCSAITTWKDELESIASQFSDTSNLTEENVKSAADDAKSATDTMRDDLQNLGAPDTESGEQVRDAVDSFSMTVEDETEKIQEAAQGVSNITELPGALSTISTSISAILTAGSEAMQTV